MSQMQPERSLAVLSEAVRTAAVAPPYTLADAEPSEPALPLSHYLWILRRHGWRIAAFVTAAVVGTLLVSLRIQPVYESTATVDIDRQTPSGVVGQEATRSIYNDSDQFLATQIRLIQSDSVLRPVVEKYKLREIEGKRSVRAAPVDLDEAPVVLENLKITRPPNTYLLRISYRSTDPRLAAEVANAIARSYLEHTYNIRIRSSQSMSAFMENQLAELKAKMERSSRALSEFERELNVINPEEKTSILSARLLQLNTEYTNAQADRVRKEATYESVRNGALEAAAASDQALELRNLATRLNLAGERFAEVKAHYGANHPEYRKAAAQLAEVEGQLEQARRNIAERVAIEYREAVNRERMLKQAVTETKAEFDRLNARSFEYQTLKREADSDKALYEELVRKIREAGINASFQSSNIRIADPARPAVDPVFPNLKLNLLLAFLFSSLLAVGAAVLSDALDSSIRDPEQIRRMTNAEVIGSLPAVKSWRRQLGTVRTSDGALVPATVSDQASHSVALYEEAIRTLRNSILLTDFDRSIRSILVTSATPSEGKSTAAAHLAVAHALQNQKTLLIDADLRRPSVHRCFNIPGATGLSDVLVSGRPWKELLCQPGDVPNLSILPAGPPSRRASDLIGRGIAELLDEAAREFDWVIVDAPPLLGFAEPLQLATVVDGVLVVARAGQTDRKAVASVVGTLRRLRANLIGIVMNEVHHGLGNGYYYSYSYSRYGKYYRPATSD
jgi:succinoglycan biosynthesis transport protein ExoP